MLEQNAYVKDLQEAYQAAKEFGTAEEARAIGKQLGVAKAERTLQNKYYKDMVAETTRKLANLNQTALAYVNNEMPWVYATNYNQAEKTAKKVGMAFNIVDESTVRRMIMDDDIDLPPKKMSIPKDMRWNTKQLNSSVLQGIVNGEPMDKIAKRILPIVDNNWKSAVRNARTMTTGAQNRGRLDSYHRLDQMGLVQQKVWMATHDERTRESHAWLDGERVDIDKAFSNGLMFPGDTNGRPEEVYNCRCTMADEVIGFRKADGRIEYVDIDRYEPDYEFEQLKPKEEGAFGPSAYTQDRKDNATWAQTKMDAYNSYVDASAEVWKKATDKEKWAINDYTGDSDDYNKPLRGYEGSWRNYVGQKDIALYHGTAENIDAATSIIAKSVTQKDMWLQRGVSRDSAVASFLQIPESDLTSLSEKELSDILVGKIVPDYAFFSCGSSKGAGFSGTIFNVYCPKGTQAIYCEPFSVFGDGDGLQWDGITRQSTVGRENETLLQRGTEFRVTKVEKGKYGDMFFDLEVVGQNPRPLVEMFKEIF